MDARKLNKKKKNEKKSNRISILLNEEEREKIIQLAEEEGLPLSTFIRWKLCRKNT